MNQANLSTETLAYLAGYFDGEGTICFTFSKNNYALRVAIATGDFDALKVFADAFGTVVHTKACRRYTLNTKRQIWEVRFYSKRAQEVLRQLLPYMRTKRVIAEAVLTVEFVDHSTAARFGTTAVEKAKRAEVAALVSAYNNRTTLLENTDKAGAVN